MANADAYDAVVALPFEAPPDIMVGPNSINQPIVADGTMSVKGKISSTKLRYFRFGDTVSYMAMMRTV